MIKLKPYFLEGKFCLYNNDYVKVMRGLSEDSVDMIFADPPYFLSNNGFTVHAGKRVSVNKGKRDKSKSAEEF